MRESEKNWASWHLYVVRCEDDSLYTGITTDIERRLEEHRSSPKGAKFLRGRGPLKLAYHCKIGDKGKALQAEYRLKQLPKQLKEEIVTNSPDLARLLRMLEIGEE